MIREDINDFQDKKYGFKIELLRRLQNLVVKKADLIITPSMYLRNLVVGWGGSQEKVNVIHNAVEFHGEMVAKEEARKVLNYTGKNIMTVARLVPWKGTDTLIDLVSKFGEETILRIVGDGPEKEKLMWLAQEKNLVNRILFIGILKREDVLIHLRASDIFILDSEYEGFSHVLVEAMKCGVPVIASDACGNPEIVEDGVDGFLVPLHDSPRMEGIVRGIFDGRISTDEVVNSAFRKCEKYSFEKMIEETESAFKGIIRHGH
ncbi:MAG: glycosyltransferase [Candidatus Aenigmarchaeota archaeon]|nr:glycosyltransferase [Candidatus Aenigmarchaeota archaeon]